MWRFSRLGVFVGLLVSMSKEAVFSDAGNEFSESWKMACLRTHNVLRHKHGLDDVNWNDFLQSLAGIKAASLVMEDYQIKIHVPQLNPSNLVKDRILFHHEISTGKGSSSPDEADLLLSLKTERIISDWCYSSRSKRLGRSSHILDPTVDKIGCSINVVAVSDRIMQIYLIVSYQRNSKKLLATLLPTIQANKVTKKKSASVCKVECPDSGMCLSYLDEKSFIEVVPCRCSFDPEMWSRRRYMETPRCSGACFAYCPFSNSEQLRTCRGKTMCTCLYTRTGAVCR